jgi:hypothetical protein
MSDNDNDKKPEDGQPPSEASSSGSGAKTDGATEQTSETPQVEGYYSTPDPGVRTASASADEIADSDGAGAQVPSEDAAPEDAANPEQNAEAAASASGAGGSGNERYERPIEEQLTENETATAQETSEPPSAAHPDPDSAGSQVSSDSDATEDVTTPVQEAEGAVAAAVAGASGATLGEEPVEQSEPEASTELRIYEYRFVRVRSNAWDSVESAVQNGGAEAVAAAGGQLYGVWLGQIGLSANQGVIVTVWTDLDSAKKHGGKAVAGIDEISASETLYLEPTARPLDAAPPEGPGVFAHRVFEVRRDDADRFISLSDEAWEQFETVFGARIYALWKEIGHDRANERLILLTRYPDYAAWEKSRYWRPDPDPNAADALQRFRERRTITVDTVVYTTRLAAS